MATEPSGSFESAPLTLGDAALFTDLYELTMAAAFLREGVRDTATFSLFVRRLPPERAFLVAAGLEDALEHLRGFRFSPDALDYVRSLDRFEPEFLTRSQPSASPAMCARCGRAPCSSPTSRCSR